MQIGEIMANVVQTVRGQHSLTEAAALMHQYDIGCLLVMDGTKVDGIVTDRDLVCRGLAAGRDLTELCIADVMTRNPVCCKDTDTLTKAAQIMEANQVRRLPVFDRQYHLVGIVSLGDISTHASPDRAGELIAEVSRPDSKFMEKIAS